MKSLSAQFGRLLEALAMLAALTLLAMVIMVTADIVLRNLTRSGFPWANEVSEYALYVITLLTAPWLLRRGQHVRIDLVLTLMPPRVAWLMEAIADVLGFAVCLLMMRYGIKMTVESAVLGLDHHQEPGVSGMVAALAAAGVLCAAGRRIRVPVRPPAARPARPPRRSDVGGVR